MIMYCIYMNCVFAAEEWKLVLNLIFSGGFSWLNFNVKVFDFWVPGLRYSLPSGYWSFFGPFVKMVTFLSIFDLSLKNYVKYPLIFFILFLPLGPIFSFEKATSPGEGCFKGSKFQNCKHFFFREETTPGGWCSRGNKMWRICDIFSLEKKTTPGGWCSRGNKM